MVGTSKILTVSYGTFSCTLEGFDDSFNTMKAIAEYFRDLAADDRYFGAEPPTPDAEMLARIAEREIARRVEARLDDGGVVLRPAALAAAAPRDSAEDDAAAEDEAPRVDADPTEENMAEAVSTDTDVEDAEVSDDDVLAEDDAEAATVEDEAVAEGIVAEPVAEDADDMVAEDEDSPVAEVEDSPVEEVSAEPVAEDAEDLVAGVEDEPVAEVENDEDDAGNAAMDPPPSVAPSHPDADSVAAKLQRIRAVVSGGPNTLETADYADDLTPAETPSGAEADLAEAPVEDPEFPATDMLARVMARHTADAEDAAAVDTAPVDTAPADTAPVDTAPVDDLAAAGSEDADLRIEANLDANVEPEKPSDPELAAISAALATSEDVRADDQPAPAPAEETADHDADADPDHPAKAADDIPPSRHRVVRVDRGQLAALAAEQAAWAREEAARPTSDAAGTDLGLLDGADEFDDLMDADEALSPEEEAELLAELSDLSDDTTRDHAGAFDEDDDESLFSPDTPSEDPRAFDEPTVDDDDTPTAPEPEAALTEADAVADPAEDDKRAAKRAALAAGPEEQALDRLMGDADAQMQEPESNRRRAAIAQLKAAVAANEAARRDGTRAEDDDEAEAENAFRDDLERVVRPRPNRPQVEGARRTERPRPAPLKLVPAQRVDLAARAGRPVEPVRPRRISGEDEGAAAAAAAGGFIEFAEDMGARDLPDLLEAAAAYTAFVEGKEEFSRLHIMHQVRAARPGEFTREDGLRSFSDLLRRGRLTKIANGRFQVAEDTPFRPERQAS